MTSEDRNRVALTYARAGVNIAEADRLVQRIRRRVRTTYTPGVLGDVGAFGAFFDARFPRFRHPVLVSSVDGVGTKLLLAQSLRRHRSIGRDLVNHCVNDIAVCGAEPLYFMDYFATGRLSRAVAAEVIDGCVDACRANGCALIGGETAEMPGVYGDDEYDLAGMIVGVAERRSLLDGRAVRAGDVLLGIPSTGLHTNGYSLARRVLLPKYRLSRRIAPLRTTLGDALLAVHRSYLGVIRALRARYPVRAFAHITGGGIEGNARRVIPAGLRLAVDWTAWKRPAIFRLIQETGAVPEADMRRTFNLGIGLVAVLPARHAAAAIASLRRRGERPVLMGEVITA